MSVIGYNANRAWLADKAARLPSAGQLAHPLVRPCSLPPFLHPDKSPFRVPSASARRHPAGTGILSEETDQHQKPREDGNSIVTRRCRAPAGGVEELPHPRLRLRLVRRLLHHRQRRLRRVPLLARRQLPRAVCPERVPADGDAGADAGSVQRGGRCWGGICLCSSRRWVIYLFFPSVQLLFFGYSCLYPSTRLHTVSWPVSRRCADACCGEGILQSNL